MSIYLCINMIIQTRLPSYHLFLGGSVFYNGDIVLDSSNEKLIFGDSDSLYRKKRAAVRSNDKLWPYGILKYKWASNIGKFYPNIE